MAELTHGTVVPAIIRLDADGDENHEYTTVLVTGFGPFLEKYPINSSWSIASTLPAIIPATAEHPDPIRIIVHPWPIRVAYQSVVDQVPGLHTSISPKPDIILHMGLAAGRAFYTLEQGAHGNIYGKNKDVDGETYPPEKSNKLWGDLPQILKTGFDTADVWKRWRRDLTDTTADIRESQDAGNYLCGFTYYTSMSQFAHRGEEQRPVMFLHVPNLPTEAGVAQGREVAKSLIRALVDSRRERSTNHGNTA